MVEVRDLIKPYQRALKRQRLVRELKAIALSTALTCLVCGALYEVIQKSASNTPAVAGRTYGGASLRG